MIMRQIRSKEAAYFIKIYYYYKKQKISVNKIYILIELIIDQNILSIFVKYQSIFNNIGHYESNLLLRYLL